VRSVKLYFFGNPQAVISDTTAELSRRKSMALLSYLAVTGKRHSRDSLAELFWPETNSRRAAANLRTIIWSLNQSPVSCVTDCQHDTVSLASSSDLWVDVTAFRQHMAACFEYHRDTSDLCESCENHLRKAVDLYQDGFMQGFTIRNSPDFEQWQFLEAQILKSEYIKALTKLITYHESQNKLECAIEFARQRIAADLLNETFHQHLMLLHAKCGHISDAVQQYNICKLRLEKDLNLPPSEETNVLIDRIRGGDFKTEETPPPKSRSDTSFPSQATHFVGRLKELSQLLQLMSAPEHRLITLTGPGGCGKTRLALQATIDWAETQNNDAVWTSLSSVSSATFIIPTLNKALQLKTSKSRSLSTSDNLSEDSTLKEEFFLYLRDKHMLLVMDNFEHVLAGRDIISQILTSAPHVKLLITSRERLNLQGEWTFEVSGMAYPEDDMESISEDWDAVNLFIQNAQRASGKFSVTSENRNDILRICQLVQGSPLAIELAAVWVKVLTCSEIAEGIETNLDFLTSSLSDVPDRHKSIRAVFEQTWQYLSPEGRAGFRKLAVFRSGFNRQAAWDIGNIPLQALASLVDKSILRRLPNDRFHMHELMRQYALEKLESVPRESEIVRRKHAQHYLRLTQNLEGSLKRFEQKSALHTLAREIENIRISWLWAAGNHEISLMLKATLSLFLYYDIRSHFQEGLEMFTAAYSKLNELTDRPDDPRIVTSDREILNGFLLAAMGWFIRYSNPVNARKTMNEALDCIKHLHNRNEWVFIYLLSIFLVEDTLSQTSVDHLEKCLQVYETNCDEWGIALTLDALSNCLRDTDLPLAEKFEERSLMLRRKAGDLWGIAMSRYTMGTIAERQENLILARKQYEQSLILRRELGEDINGVIESLERLGSVSFQLKEYDAAFEYYKESIDLSEKMSDFRRTASLLGIIGERYDSLGQTNDAAEYLKRCQTLCYQSDFSAEYMSYLGILDRILMMENEENKEV
jgi:predicted ATPase/DNA-binding SARP family transcriptional activator/tetratricopeptide (TPR) repeat protein